MRHKGPCFRLTAQHAVPDRPLRARSFVLREFDAARSRQLNGNLFGGSVFLFTISIYTPLDSHAVCVIVVLVLPLMRYCTAARR
jgi:hypothetical protein